MCVAKKVQKFMHSFMVQGLVLLVCNGIAFPQNLHHINSDTTSKSISPNFYKTDSIFSFRSSKGYFPSLLQNFGEQATVPFRFKAKQWIITGAVIGITTLLIQNDGNIDNWAKIQMQDINWVKKSSPVITEFGSNYGIGATCAFGLFSAAFKNQKGIQSSLLATQAMITSGIWVQLIKQFAGRERPNASYNNIRKEGGLWYGPLAQYDHELAIKKPGSSFDAFVSGHTATAFSIASVFASQYNDTPVIPIISYTAASLVGVSRLTEHKHWASDVFAGALLGYLCGKQVVKHFNKIHQNNFVSITSKQKTKTEFTLIQNGNQFGFLLKW